MESWRLAPEMRRRETLGKRHRQSSLAVCVLVIIVDLVVAYMNGVGHVSEERLLGAKAHLLIMVISSYTKAIKGH